MAKENSMGKDLKRCHSIGFRLIEVSDLKERITSLKFRG